MSAVYIAFAQKPTVTLQGGITSASLQGDAAESFRDFIEKSNGRVTSNSKTGIYAGVDGNIPLGEHFSFQPGLHYTQKGYELKGEMTIKGAEFMSPNAKARLTTHYVEVPALLSTSLAPGLEIALGPQLSYLAKADLRATAGAAGFNFYRRDFDATEKMNQWDAGVRAAAAYQLGSGLRITAGYTHGLMKADANENMDVYNRSFNVGLGYRF